MRTRKKGERFSVVVWVYQSVVTVGTGERREEGEKVFLKTINAGR